MSGRDQRNGWVKLARKERFTKIGWTSYGERNYQMIGKVQAGLMLVNTIAPSAGFGSNETGTPRNIRSAACCRIMALPIAALFNKCNTTPEQQRLTIQDLVGHKFEVTLPFGYKSQQRFDANSVCTTLDARAPDPRIWGKLQGQ